MPLARVKKLTDDQPLCSLRRHAGPATLPDKRMQAQGWPPWEERRRQAPRSGLRTGRLRACWRGWEQPGSSVMAKAIHMMVRVLDLDRSIAFYRTAFELDVADRFDFDSFTLVYLRNSEADFEVELTLNKVRGRADPEQGPRRALRARRRLRPHRLLRRRSRRRASAADRGRARPQPDQGIPPRRDADGEVLLRPGPGRVQDRGSAAARSLPLAAAAVREAKE
jgi:catechol 2,3-dioxygenase-like lactoylglutathione lyase family enzyme